MKTFFDVVYIGDELGAAGYRLAGADARVPRPGGEAECLDAARSEARLVLLSAASAACISAETLEAALVAAAPLVMVVPEQGPGGERASPAEKVRRTLGVET